ncbi:MAG: hypothetical protein SF053_22260 [Bacteroidia bacterium]|nr:hypothetical protein [Bacteroidia bacterium]
MRLFSALYIPVMLLAVTGCQFFSTSTPFSMFTSGVSLVEITEPREAAFTVQLPKDWDIQLALVRPHEQTRSIGFAKSPDGRDCVFFGDTRLPMCYIPAPHMGMPAGMNMGSPLLLVTPFVAADRYFQQYVKDRYGRLPGFRITGITPNPEHQQLVEAAARRNGIQAQITTARVSFEFEEGGERAYAQVNGTTFQIQQVWMSDVYGFITLGDTTQMSRLTGQIVSTLKPNPRWQEQENLRHQQKMAAMQAQTRQIQEQTRLNTLAHQQRMQQMHQNFNAHQQRMQDLQASHDAHNQAWAAQQGLQDRQHERFIDYIREEETVTNGQQTGKVESGYSQYYVNPQTGAYIGTNSYENPDASVYELWHIKK